MLYGSTSQIRYKQSIQPAESENVFHMIFDSRHQLIPPYKQEAFVGNSFFIIKLYSGIRRYFIST